MSGSIRSRRRWRRAALRLTTVVILLGVTATLAAGLQVHELRITGTNRFPRADIEATLRHALGASTIATRAEDLRSRVRAVPWVADARVHMSLDGVVTCEVEERLPVAVAVDGNERLLTDSRGRLLAEAPVGSALVELVGFAGHPDERAAVLAAVSSIEEFWGGRVARVVRLAPRDIELHFSGASPVVIADPGRPALLATARQVLAAWLAATNQLPQRVDARVPGRVAVLPGATEEAI